MRTRIRSWLERMGLLEAAVLASMLTIVGSVWIFVEVADEVHEGESKAFDEWVLRSFRTADGASPIGPPWLLQVSRDLTALGSATVITIVTAVAVGFLALRRKWGALTLVVVSILGGGIVS